MERKVIKPSFNHYGLITGRLAEMKAWYETVIGMTTIHDQSLHGALAKSQSRVIERSDLPSSIIATRWANRKQRS
jgi:catechol-2,3-dioxygenase